MFLPFAVTGSTGQLGRLVVAQLVQDGYAERTVALARTPEKAADLGVAARAFDYDRPETLAPALEGVRALLLISGNELGRRIPQHAAVIEAAKASGVERIVYTSLLHAGTSPLSLAAEHLATEELLAASGLEFTILRNGWYMENHTAALPLAIEHGALVGAAGDGRIAGAMRADYAEAAARVLVEDEHAGRTYELAGDEPYTVGEIAEEVARQTGDALPYRSLPEAEYAKVLEGAGLPPELAAAVASWDARIADGALDANDDTLSELIGHPTTPLRHAVMAALQPNA